MIESVDKETFSHNTRMQDLVLIGSRFIAANRKYFFSQCKEPAGTTFSDGQGQIRHYAKLWTNVLVLFALNSSCLGLDKKGPN